MIHPTKSALAAMLSVFFPLAALAANEPIILEVENAVIGDPSDPAVFQTLTESGVTFVRVVSDVPAGVTENPGTPSRVITFHNVTFPAGTYDLYARLRVGAGNANDDSFYYGTGFGVKPVTLLDASANNSWVKNNGLNAVGFTVLSDIVAGPGSAGFSVWKWVRLSQTTGTSGEAPLQFVVPAVALTQTLQIGSRENGLDFDKFAFAPSAFFYKVSNLDNGEPGSSTPPPPPFTPPGPPIAIGQAKFLGCAYSGAQAVNFRAYWNQVTPENAAKWGSVEATRDTMVWTELDAAYALAKTNGFSFKFHTLIWGNQQPAWIESLPIIEQREEIEEWFAAVAARYPDIDQIDVVNEPLHDPPNSPGNGGGNYLEALGGAGVTGWDWVITSFQLARQYFPNAKLHLNDFSIVNSTTDTLRFLEIVELLQAGGWIDGIGEQAHAFSTRGSMDTVMDNLDVLGTAGLPIYITELDIDGPTDEIQLADYQRIFPTFWEHPAVRGITLWGYRPGHWRTAQGAYIVLANGAERPAMLWLQNYVHDHPPVVTAGQSFSVSESAAGGAVVGTVLATDVDPGTVLQQWAITGGTGAAVFAIDPNSGAIALNSAATLDFETTTSFTLVVTVRDQYQGSAPETVTINVSNENDRSPVVTPAQSFAIDGGACNTIGTVLATDADDTNQPGFTTLQNWRITGGTGAAIFAIDPATGALTIAHPRRINFRLPVYTVTVSVSDGLNTSAAATVTITIPRKIRLCHKGRSKLVSRGDVLDHLRHGDCIGACVDGCPTHGGRCDDDDDRDGDRDDHGRGGDDDHHGDDDDDRGGRPS